MQGLIGHAMRLVGGCRRQQQGARLLGASIRTPGPSFIATWPGRCRCSALHTTQDAVATENSTFFFVHSTFCFVLRPFDVLLHAAVPGSANAGPACQADPQRITGGVARVASQKVGPSAVVRSARRIQLGVHGIDCASQGAPLEQLAAGRARIGHGGSFGPATSRGRLPDNLHKSAHLPSCQEENPTNGNAPRLRLVACTTGYCVKYQTAYARPRWKGRCAASCWPSRNLPS